MGVGRNQNKVSSALFGGGEMGRRTREFDWSQTPVGPIENWPQGLKSAIQIMLGSRYAMWLGWGTEFTFFYNDAYAEMTLGPKHPWALGRSAREVWSEIWDDIGPRAESVIQTGEATWDEGLLLFLERQGFPEETYHTFSYSPLPNDDGGIGGMLCVVTEDTERTIGERRLRTLRELAARTTDEARSVQEACRTASDILAGNSSDVPFSLLYLLDGDGRSATLTHLTGVTEQMETSPPVIDLHDTQGSWPFHLVVESGAAVELDDIQERFGALSVGRWSDPPSRAYVLPLTKPGQVQLAGFLVAGLSPRLQFDDAYRGFLDLVAGQIATAIANARAYEEERRRVEMLAELDRAKTTFFSNVSHEFRTPLTLMLGPVEDLLDASDSDLAPSVKGQLEVVNRNGLRLLRLVNSLLDFSRIEAGRVQAAFQPTDLASYTIELASVFRSACERAGLNLVVSCPPLKDPVFIDRDMWEKIVLNLLSNAFKFTFEGEIAVTLEQVGRSVELRIRDTGTGVPQEEMPRLFERFHRIENAHGRTHEGSGIGLALVQELVKLHGGSISAVSEIGTGTEFTVSIPLGTAHLPADQVGECRGRTQSMAEAMPFVEEAIRWLPSEERDDGQLNQPLVSELLSMPLDGVETGPDEHQYRVLVADDNSDMRQYIVRLLSEKYSVVAAADGKDAFKLALRHPPDLILSDVMMPRLDGFGLLQKLRSDDRTRDIPVILLSARAGEESRVEGIEAGADDYLVKPFSARELLARVGGHLQISRMRKESEQAIRESEERLRLALSATRMVAWEMDPSTRSVTMTGNVSEVFGIQPEMKLSHIDDYRTLLHFNDLAQHRRTVEKAVEDCGHYLSQYRLVRPDNDEIVWMEERGHGVADQTGKTRRLIGVVMDITDRKRAQEELRKERDLLDVTLASIGDAVITTDVEGRVTKLNRIAEILTGWTDSEAAGEPLESVFHIVNEETRLRAENPALRALQEGVIMGLANHTILIAKDGTERPIDDSAAPIRGSEQTVVGSVLVFRDVTTRRKEESLLTNQNKVLEQVVRGGPLDDVLDFVCLAVEQHIPGGVIATILLADEDEKSLRPVAGRRCPKEYAASLGSVPVGPTNGSCGTAAYRKEPVIVTDIATDPLWDDFRDAALPHKLCACWSVPILSSTGSVLGTFAVYSHLPRTPDEQDLRVMEFLARTAGIAIERHRAEQALRESELRYRLVGQAANDAIWDWDLITNQVRWNEGLQSRFGYTEEEIGDDASWWIENIHPEDRDRVSHGIHAAIDGDVELWNDEYRYRCANGSYAEVFDRGRVVRENGQPVRMVGSMLDVTERNRSEAALRESEERFRGIFTQTLAGIAETDLSGNFVQANQRYCEIVGRSIDELLTLRMQDITHPDDLVRNMPLFKEAVESGTPFVIEKRYLRPDGSYVWVSNSVSVVHDSTGEPVHVVAASIDITDSKRAEAALRESEAHFRSMADNAPTMIWVTDATGSCTYISKQWCEYTNTTQEENLGIGWTERVHPEDRDSSAEIFQNANQQQIPFSMDYRLLRHDGEYRWAMDTGLPRFDDEGRYQGYVGTVTDIHERKQAAESLRKVAAELSEANRRKTEFLATLGHELRNPLAPIRTGLELMKMLSDDPETMEETRSMMEQQAQQMVRLIDDLLDVSRITQGKLQLKTCQVKLAEVVRSAVDAIRPFLDEAGHTLTVNLPDQPIHLVADPNRLAQLLSNLLNNSTKYTPEGGRIWLTAEREENEVVIKVKDNGIGISSEWQSTIFEMFNQIDRPLEEGYKGLGIGLTLVKQLAEMHGGRVDVFSEGDGQGSEFIVRLPLSSETVDETISTSATDSKTIGAPLRILVVDDNKAAADMLAMVVRRLGNLVRTAYDGQQAIEMTSEFMPDVVLMDLGMPRMNGYEASRHIRQQPWGKDVVLVALTGWGQDEDRQRTKEAGFDHHLVKPAEPEELKKLFTHVIEAKS